MTAVTVRATIITMSVGSEDVFFTTKGTLAPFPLENGGCQFVLCNPNSKEKQETRVFIDTLRLLANYLGQAKEAVRTYKANKEKQSNKGTGEAEETAGGSEDAESTRDGGESERVDLFTRPLTEYTIKGLKMKTKIESFGWQDNAYIFLKRYWYLEDEQKWLPCKGGFQFTVNDNAHEMLAFAQRYQDKFGAKKEAENTSAQVLVQLVKKEEEEEEDSEDGATAAKKQRLQ